MKMSLASAAAMFALTAVAHAAPAPAGTSGTAIGAGDTVECFGVNSCKGQSDCKTAAHACKGQNACKGQGFKDLSAKACLDKGGVIGNIG